MLREAKDLWLFSGGGIAPETIRDSSPALRKNDSYEAEGSKPNDEKAGSMKPFSHGAKIPSLLDS